MELDNVSRENPPDNIPKITPWTHGHNKPDILDNQGLVHKDPDCFIDKPCDKHKGNKLQPTNTSKKGTDIDITTERAFRDIKPGASPKPRHRWSNRT